MVKTRKSFTSDVEKAVLTKCRRRCAFCFGLEGDVRRKPGQIAHIDRDASNSSSNNAAYLCLVHHAEYDSSSRQTKGLIPEELIIHQHNLLEAMTIPGFLKSDGDSHAPRTKRRSRGVSLEVYDRRAPMYRATKQFLRDVFSDLKPETKAILDFARETEEALFLFDSSIADYLADLFRRAFRLQALAHSRDAGPFVNWTEAQAKEELELTMWFSNQFEQIQTRFAPFLRLE